MNVSHLVSHGTRFWVGKFSMHKFLLDNSKLWKPSVAPAPTWLHVMFAKGHGVAIILMKSWYCYSRMDFCMWWWSFNIKLNVLPLTCNCMPHVSLCCWCQRLHSCSLITYSNVFFVDAFHVIDSLICWVAVSWYWKWLHILIIVTTGCVCWYGTTQINRCVLSLVGMYYPPSNSTC